jgi:ABC-type multidrug transport system fused ATPase/permease subunit
MKVNQHSDLPLPTTTRGILFAIWTRLSSRRQAQICLLLLLMLFSAIAELVSLGTVVPFLSVLSNPYQLWSLPIVKASASYLGIISANQLVMPCIILFAVAACLSGIVRISNLWANARIAALIGSDLSCEAYERTLYQPYIVHVNQNSAAIIAGTTSQLVRIVSALTSVLQLATSAFVACALILGLLVISTPIALGSILLLGCCYALFSVKARHSLRNNSKMISVATQHQIKALQEGLGGIRDVIIDGNQSSYLDIYRKADLPQRILQSNNQFITTFPRYAIESLGLIAIATVSATLYSKQSLGVDALPLFGAFALGAQRLLPAVQVIYGSWSGIRGCTADFHCLLELLSQPLPSALSPERPFSFRDRISLTNIFFRYHRDSEFVLRGLSLTIRKGERIGIIGSTGSGKSTTMDILLGLLPPTTGTICIDGHDLWNPAQPTLQSSWMSAVAHVPQNIFLTDASIAENIAFGVPQQNINMERVVKAAQHANISDYIDSCKHGYKSFVGERGIRLSGGQRQRIGIARALYKDAKILVLDEATSALDNDTEASVIDTIESLGNDLTIIMIAHRLSTLSRCDRIIRLSHGVAVVGGHPSTLTSTSLNDVL